MKNFLIKYKNEKKAYHFTVNLISKYFFDYKEKIFPNDSFKNLHSLYNSRYTIYGTDETEEILKNELKTEFHKMNLDLTLNYSYEKYIIDLALFEAINEISRLLTNNSMFFVMMFKLNDFKDFEIKYYKSISIEDTETYKSLANKLYPKSDFEITDFELQENDKIDFEKASFPKAIAMLHEIGFFNLDKVKNLSLTSQYEIISIITGNQNIRSIKGNVSVLTDYSNENRARYTSNTHLEEMRKKLNEIK
ncbi:hypothetical protein [Flavobacterium sp.]|uniref:hypothetical protein n=1 Tax=Flavobacterium sp. TaxID=239 RepID=UPI003752E21A